MDTDYLFQRLSHFLKGYRRRHQLSQGELSKQLQMTRSTLSRLENEPQNQVVHTLELLDRFATLEHQGLMHFISYLTEHPATPSVKSELFPWQEILLKVVGKIKQSIRIEVVDVLANKEVEEIADAFKIWTRLAQLDPKKRQLVAEIVQEMTDKARS